MKRSVVSSRPTSGRWITLLAWRCSGIEPRTAIGTYRHPDTRSVLVAAFRQQRSQSVRESIERAQPWIGGGAHTGMKLLGEAGRRFLRHGFECPRAVLNDMRHGCMEYALWTDRHGSRLHEVARLYLIDAILPVSTDKHGQLHLLPLDMAEVQTRWCRTNVVERRQSQPPPGKPRIAAIPGPPSGRYLNFGEPKELGSNPPTVSGSIDRYPSTVA